MIRSVRFFCFFLIINALLRVFPVSGQSRIAHLHNGDVAISANADEWLSAFTGTEPRQVLVSFSALPDEGRKIALARNGITLVEYLPDNTYTAIVQPPLSKEVLLSFSIHGFAEIRPEWKAGKYIWEEVALGNKDVEVLVTFCPGVDKNSVQQLISTLGGKLKPGKLEQYGSRNVVIIGGRVRSLAQWYGVQYISPVFEMEPCDLISRPVVKGNIASAAVVSGGYGLNGDSVVVGVGDDCSGVFHADIKDRIRNYNPAPKGHHGSHVNGIVAGAGNVDPFAIGMAPHSSLIDFLYDLVLPATGTMFQNFNMTLTNNSYTVVGHNCSYHGTYDAYSNFLDSLSLQYPYVLHVFASGNDGRATCTPYPQGFATVAGGYQPAKNNIVVGSVLDGLVPAEDESRGPMKDGRLKPEITAVGVVAWSSILEDEYEWAAGTSMASPQVAGGLALLTQRYKHLHGGAQPYGDILKTILLNGAMDYGNPGPDFSYGFGIMDMYRSLDMLEKDHFYINGLNHGDSQLTGIVIPPNTAQLKVMLCWNDVPASPVSAIQLVNDLDLNVVMPSGSRRRPLVPDPTPANVNNSATEKEDHINNVEQVTITNPPAGTYNIVTKAYNVPRGPQRFVVAYDLIPKHLQLTHPIGGEQFLNTATPFDTLRVLWDAVSDGNTFKVEFSSNDGASWATMVDNVPADARYAGFMVGGINSGKCRVRVSRNGTSEVQTSSRFNVCQRPVAVLDTTQCPGYVNIHWSPTPGAASYYLWSKIGKYMQVVDSTVDTAYSFRGMPLTGRSYVAVQPVLDGMPGLRSVAAIRVANSGSCTKPVSAGDLMVESLVSANGGRQHTNSAFTSSSVVKVRLRNLYAAACSNYVFSYRVNAGPWQTMVTPVIIPANSTADVDIPSSMSAVGTYNYDVAVQNTGLADPVPANDSLSFTIKSLPNDTLNLSSPFTDGFETMPVFSVSRDSMGVSPDGHWDFFNDDGLGRMRSNIDYELTLTGARSVSLDQVYEVPSGSHNKFVGTFNLDNYDTATAEIRLDFDYMLHGIPASAEGNLVAARAYDTLPWNPVYSYDLTGYPGALVNVRSLSLTDAVRLSGRNFTSATQVYFGQNDTSIIAAESYGNGITIDNFRMYTVTNDAALVSILSPVPSNCGLSGPQPLIVRVHNGVNYTLHNVQLFYRVNGGAILSGTIDSIKPKGYINYTFPQLLDMSGGTTHNVSVWLSVAGDSYLANDSIINYRFRNNPVITSFPYLENFENGDGNYYSDGYNNSWQYGTPSAARINKAASGTKAWKTNLSGYYKNLEMSYLYSPCYDISALANPMLSFSAALDIENCGPVLCDAAYVECSFDGSTWIKLGSVGQGTNWYDSTFNIWNTEGFTRWHVASVPLPNPGSGASIRFRFALSTDPGVTQEGLAIDDIHIFDRGKSILPPANVMVTQTPAAGKWNDYLSADSVIAALHPGAQNAPGTTVALFRHDTLHNPASTQYSMPRSYTINAAEDADSMQVRLYITDEEVAKTYADTLCRSCTKFPDAYSLGITQYVNLNNPIAQNGTLADDTGGAFTFHPASAVKWVPYDNGYYAEIKAKPYSEYWFNDGGPTGDFPAGIDYLDFFAYSKGTYVVNTWYSRIDSFVNIYTPQWSPDSVHFGDILDTPALHRKEAAYSIDDYVNFAKFPVLWFRLRWTMAGKPGYFYSPIRRVGVGDSASTMITFDARMVNHSQVQLSWDAKLDAAVDHYVLERARGNGDFTHLADVRSLHSTGYNYRYYDVPGALPSGALLRYRLTAVLSNGATIVLPIRTVEWVNGNTITNVYPNPTHDGALTIDWQADPGSVLRLAISDVMGKRIYENTATSTRWNNTTTISTFRGPRGIYFLTAYIDGNKYVMKLVYE